MDRKDASSSGIHGDFLFLLSRSAVFSLLLHIRKYIFEINFFFLKIFFNIEIFILCQKDNNIY